jgi:hypothetical protein
MGCIGSGWFWLGEIGSVYKMVDEVRASDMGHNDSGWVLKGQDGSGWVQLGPVRSGWVQLGGVGPVGSSWEISHFDAK